MSFAEAKWTVDQIVQKIAQPPNNMRAFTAFSVSKNSIGIKFLEPADSYDANGNLICSVGGVKIYMSEEKYPTNPSEGKLVLDNAEPGKYSEQEFVIGSLIQDTPYYLSAFPYSTQGAMNLSSHSANRATATPADGETANVTIDIDDPVAFGSVTVTCVDETNPEATKSAMLTSSKRKASFIVPIGDTYHIEYGSTDGYSQPENTSPKKSVAGAVSNYTAHYSYFTSTINVKYPAGATCTCSCDGTTYTAPSTSGSYAFKVHKVGTWLIEAKQGSEKESTTVSITNNGQTKSVELSFVKIYGIVRNVGSNSSAWARTDNAVGMTAKATLGTSRGSSDFDNAMPWKGMVKETLPTNDIMVKIPKFYFKRYKSGSEEHIQIADKPKSGFAIHPAFNHNGVEQDFIYVGAYHTSSGNKSVKNAAPLVNQTRAGMRSGAKGKGAGWSIIDVSALSALQMLALVEYADNNVQTKMGRGYCDGNSSAINSGSCDSISGHTGRPAGTDGKTGVVYRGVENLWGNIWSWVDGVNVNNGEFWICNTISKYADDTSSGYTKLSYKGQTNWSSSYITEVGIDSGNNSHVMLPSAAGSGSESTYMCDACWSSTAWRVFGSGGAWRDGSFCGLFAAALNDVSSFSYSNLGSRLLYVPS